jgi:hypothetical protein
MLNVSRSYGFQLKAIFNDGGSEAEDKQIKEHVDLQVNLEDIM